MTGIDSRSRTWMAKSYHRHDPRRVPKSSETRRDDRHKWPTYRRRKKDGIVDAEHLDDVQVLGIEAATWAWSGFLLRWKRRQKGIWKSCDHRKLVGLHEHGGLKWLVDVERIVSEKAQDREANLDLEENHALKAWKFAGSELGKADEVVGVWAWRKETHSMHIFLPREHRGR